MGSLETKQAIFQRSHFLAQLLHDEGPRAAFEIPLTMDDLSEASKAATFCSSPEPAGVAGVGLNLSRSLYKISFSLLFFEDSWFDSATVRSVRSLVIFRFVH